jgi:hypothetical protein
MGLKYWMLDPAPWPMHSLDTRLSSRGLMSAYVAARPCNICLQVDFTHYFGGSYRPRLVFKAAESAATE